MRHLNILSKEENEAFNNSSDYIFIDGIKRVFIIFIILYGLFGFTDSHFFPEYYKVLLMLRFGLVIPLFVVTIVLAYTNRLIKIYNPWISFNYIVGGLVIAYMLILSPENMVYYGGLFMIYFSGYFLLNLRFIYASISGLIVFSFHVLGTVFYHQVIPEVFLYSVLFFFGANLIGMIGLKNIENLHIRQFLKDKEIGKMNHELVEQYKEKDLQLKQLETFVNENKELHFKYNEKEKLNDKLREIENRFEQLASQSKTFYYELDLLGKFIYASSSVKEILGYEIHELVNDKYFYDLFPSEYKDKFKDVGFYIMSKEEVVDKLINPLRTKTGETIWVTSYMIPVYNDDDKLVAYRGSDMDITENRNTQQALEIFRTISEVAEYGSLLTNIDGEIVYANQAFCFMHGYEKEEVLGNHLSMNHTEIQMKHVNQLIELLIDKGGFKSEEVWHKKKDDSVFPTIMSAKIIYENDEPKYISATLIDITDQKRTQNELLDSEKRYRIVSEVSNTGVWEFDISQNYMWCSQEYYSMLGYDKKDFKDAPNNVEDACHSLVHPEDIEYAKSNFALYVKEKSSSGYENHFRMKTIDGDYRWIWSRGNFVKDEKNIPTNIIIGTHIDVTEKKEKEKEIIYVSNHDYLTNIPNRRYYQEVLMHYDSDAFYPLGIVIMDLNGLKIINDAFGHESGNEALVKIAEVLRKSARKDDFIARIGGDEFAMLCPNVTSKSLDKQMQNIIRLINDESVNEVFLSIAVGTAIKHDKKDKLANTLTNAENNMYKNKVLTSLSTRNNAIHSILQTLQNKYIVEKIHSESVSEYCGQIGVALGLKSEEVKELQMAGLYHDIGKISIPDAILHKPGKLNDKEWEIMRNHTTNGYQILRAADQYSNIAEYAMSHHERIDGNGYPNGVKGNDIPLFSKIICVADAYEAMTSNRPYRKALKSEDAISELLAHAGTQFDENIVNIFIEGVLKKTIA